MTMQTVSLARCLRLGILALGAAIIVFPYVFMLQPVARSLRCL